MPAECLCCGEANPWVINKVDFIAPFRDTEHCFRAEVHQCRSCDAVTTTEEQSAAISAQVREAHGKWISEKLKKAQRELGLSLRDLAERTCVAFATLGRISSGDHLIDPNTEKLLWMEIEKLIHAHQAAEMIQMGHRMSTFSDGAIAIKSDPIKSLSYSRILQTVASSQERNRSDNRQDTLLPALSHSNLIFA